LSKKKKKNQTPTYPKPAFIQVFLKQRDYFTAQACFAGLLGVHLLVLYIPCLISHSVLGVCFRCDHAYYKQAVCSLKFCFPV